MEELSDDLKKDKNELRVIKRREIQSRDVYKFKNHFNNKIAEVR